MGVIFDTSDFNKGMSNFNKRVPSFINKAVNVVADEIIRLSQFEVPHDTGQLQNTGHVEPGSNEAEAIVGYNKVYAAKLHEHPEYRFQKGRKGKYLEDPIKNNLATFNNFFAKAFGELFK